MSPLARKPVTAINLFIPYPNTCNTKAMLTLVPSPPAPGASNSIFNNIHSLLRYPLGPNSKTLSL